MSHYLKIGLLTFILALVLVACGGSNEPTGTPAPTQTPFPTFEFVAPTNPPAFNTTPSTADVEATPDTQLIDRGRGRYETLECVACHGANGEGSDDGSSLLEFALNEADFVSFMRSGGDVGSDHQYSTDRLSQSGARNLYFYLVSLADGGE